MPQGHNIGTSENVLYSGDAFTPEEKEEAAQVQQQSLSDWVASKGRTVESVNGGVLEGGTPNQ